MLTLLSIVVALAALTALAGLRIANQYARAVVFRLGRYHSTRGPGLYWIIAVRRMAVHDRSSHQHDRGRGAGNNHASDNVPIKVTLSCGTGSSIRSRPSSR